MRINTEYRNGILFVRLNGNLINKNVDVMNRKVTNLIYRAGIRNVVFNVKKMKKIDFKGINSLLYNYELVKKNDGNIFICGENENVKKYLKYNHVFKYIAEINDELCAMNLMKG